METKTLTIVVEKDLVTIVEKQMNATNIRFGDPETAKDYAESLVSLYDDSWKVTIR